MPASIRVEGAHQISIDEGNVRPAQEIVSKTAQLYFYDWEPNVVGPNGTTGSNSGALTGGEERRRWARVCPSTKRSCAPPGAHPSSASNDTTLQPGCTAAQVDGCIYGSWYLLYTKHQKWTPRKVPLDKPVVRARAPITDISLPAVRRTKLESL